MGNFLRLQVNEDIFYIIDKDRRRVILEICYDEYDITDKILPDGENGPVYRGYIGFPIKIKGYPFGCGLITTHMESLYDLNNMTICFYDYPETSLKMNNIDLDEYKNINIESIFKQFNGDYRKESFLGYGTQYIELHNSKIPELQMAI